jgi:crotonobetainyl-CoA:carnitine CoA-transferase CaiB-like acyl-CoA transferase
VEPEFLRRTSAEWEQLLTEHDVPYAPMLTMSDYVHHPQVEWLELVEPPESGLSLLRPPWRFGQERPHRDPHVASVGEDTRAIALEVLKPERVDRLAADGVLFIG